MKKPKFTLFKEFKEFISRGSVMDLAVGMIIGAAFTAIITAVVNGILKPLINLIPLSETGLQTVLRPAVLDAEGNVLTEALILDWGAVISAIITFLLTALVLFIIIKVINTAKRKAEQAKAKAEELAKKALKKDEEPAEAVAEEAPVEEPAAPAAPVETTDDLLREIRDLLKAQKKDEE